MKALSLHPAYAKAGAAAVEEANAYEGPGSGLAVYEVLPDGSRRLYHIPKSVDRSDR